jgi:hypothetical protein
MILTDSTFTSKAGRVYRWNVAANQLERQDGSTWVRSHYNDLNISQIDPDVAADILYLRKNPTK